MPEGAKAGLVLIGAACVGIAIGAYQVLGPRHPIADEVAAQPSQELKEIVVPEFSDDDGMPSGRRGRKGSPVPRLARDERGVGLRASAPLSPVANGAAGRIAWWTATPST